MVRRRGRPPKEVSSTPAIVAMPMSTTVDTSSLLEEQNFASPKRKDCKIEETQNVARNGLDVISSETRNGIATAVFGSLESKDAARTRAARNATRNHGVPLATRSQTRTIENYFKEKQKTANNNNENKDNDENTDFGGTATTGTKITMNGIDNDVIDHLEDSEDFISITTTTTNTDRSDTISNSASSYLSSSVSPLPLSPQHQANNFINQYYNPDHHINGYECAQNDPGDYFYTISEEDSNEASLNPMRVVDHEQICIDSSSDVYAIDDDNDEVNDFNGAIDIHDDNADDGDYDDDDDDIEEIDDEDNDGCNASDEATSNGAEKINHNNNTLTVSDLSYKAVHQLAYIQRTSMNIYEGRSSRTSSTNTNASSSCYSNASNITTENIFLQEPVLHLNVDKSPNQASSIKINKTLEAEHTFSSPSSKAASILHGQFNQIVSINGCSPTKQAVASDNNNFCAVLKNNCHNDNRSCDSSSSCNAQNLPKAIDLRNENVRMLSTSNDSPSIELEATPSRRRKPATPHRIVCPSPTKVPASPTNRMHRGTSSMTPRSAKKAETMISPRKSPRHLSQSTGACAPSVDGDGGGGGTAATTRRRLKDGFEETSAGAVKASPRKDSAKNERLEEEKPSHPHESSAYDEDEELEHMDILCFVSKLSNSINGDSVKSVGICAEKTITATGPSPQKNRSKTNKSQQYANKQMTMSGGTVPLPKKNKQQQKQKKAFVVPTANTGGSRELTEFFPVRRSVRKTKTAVIEEQMRNMEQAVLEERAEGLRVEYFEGKGRGVVTDRHIQRNEFVVEYIGDLISMQQAVEREQCYALDENAGCYMYYFRHKNQQYCIDATADTGKLGRLVNHSRNGNLIPKVIVVKQQPHLVLVAKDDIMPGEELTYDYGDRSKESLLHYPWLAY